MTSPVPSSMSMVTAQMVNQINGIASAVNNAGGDKTTAQILKGIVQAVHWTTSPPTIDVHLSGDSSTLVQGIVFSDAYTPFVGDTVLCIEQGNTVMGMGQLAAGGTDAANGWISSTTTPTAITLGSGTTDSGNGGGPVEARLKMESGSLKVELRGIANWGGSNPLCTLPTGTGFTYRPAARRCITGACSQTGEISVRLDVNTDGTINVVQGGSTGSSSPGTSSSGVSGGISTDSQSESVSVSGGDSGSTGGASAGTAHTHGYSGGFSGGGSTSGHSHGGSFSGGSHSHTVNSHTHAVSTGNPSWISLDGLSFYL